MIATQTDLDTLEVAYDALRAVQGDNKSDWQREARAVHLAETAARIAGGEYRPEYNGWPNRETWNTALWIDNDQGSQEVAREIVAQAIAHYDPTLYEHRASFTAEDHKRLALSDAADALKDWWDDGCNATPLNGPVQDAWSYMVACVDWRRIAESLTEE